MSISQPPSASFGLLVADNTLLVTRALWTDHVAWLGVMALLEAVLAELMFALGALGHGRGEDAGRRDAAWTGYVRVGDTVRKQHCCTL